MPPLPESISIPEASGAAVPLNDEEKIRLAQLEDVIQKSLASFYAGGLAGYDKGILEYRGKRFLILDSPTVIEPRRGDWPLLQGFLEKLLDAENTDQISYFNGWMKIAQESLRAHVPRPGQAVALIGEKECGKSLLQDLITELFGGRMAK